MLPWRYRVVPRAINYPFLLLGWLLAVLPFFALAHNRGDLYAGLRLVSDEPAPIYVVPGVDPERVEWTHAGMRIAWDAVPAILGVPLPGSEIAVMLFPETTRLALHVQKRRELDSLPNVPGCLADVRREPHAILCETRLILSPEIAAMIMGHELTHHLIPPVADLPGWYGEGLAEYVGTQVLLEYIDQAPECQSRERSEAGIPCWSKIVWSAYERPVVDELRAGRQLALDQRWTASNLDYARAAVTVRWLVERHGMGLVVEVAHETARSGSFTMAFANVLGLDSRDFKHQVEADLKVRLQTTPR
jgi:hypothetical protein